MFPIAPLVLGATAIGGAFKIAGAVADLGYNYGRYKENEKYWADYKKNTGITPRYKYRSGYNFNTSFIYNDIGNIFGAIGRTGISYGYYQKYKG